VGGTYPFPLFGLLNKQSKRVRHPRKRAPASIITLKQTHKTLKRGPILMAAGNPRQFGNPCFYSKEREKPRINKDKSPPGHSIIGFTTSFLQYP
jgi:hypothetical protein